jgi:hypothetical protein
MNPDEESKHNDPVVDEDFFK